MQTRLQGETLGTTADTQMNVYFILPLLNSSFSGSPGERSTHPRVDVAGQREAHLPRPVS